MSEPTPRQVLYGLVAGGFQIVVVVLIVGAAAAGLVPLWWTATISVIVLAVAVWMLRHWRRTGPLLALAIGVFLVWMVGTLLVAA